MNIVNKLVHDLKHKDKKDSINDIKVIKTKHLTSYQLIRMSVIDINVITHNFKKALKEVNGLIKQGKE